MKAAEFDPYLIFVTGTKGSACGDKFYLMGINFVMWRHLNSVLWRKSVNSSCGPEGSPYCPVGSLYGPVGTGTQMDRISDMRALSLSHPPAEFVYIQQHEKSITMILTWIIYFSPIALFLKRSIG